MISSFVIDCSITMAWCFADESTAYTEKILNQLKSHSALAPSLWPLEVANVLLVAERKRRLTAAQSFFFTELLQALPITIDESTHNKALKETLSLAREYQLSSYDAAYLELSIRAGLPLATQDNDLKKAAKKCGVKMFE